MEMVNDLIQKIEALPTKRAVLLDGAKSWDAAEEFSDTDDLKALAADFKRLTDENARLKGGVTTKALAMLKEAALHHTVRDSPDYNECEVSPCMFCLKVAELGGE